jgi:type II secretory pathway component PulF
MLLFFSVMFLFLCGVLSYYRPRTGFFVTLLAAVVMVNSSVVLEQEHYILAAVTILLVGTGGVYCSRTADADIWPRRVIKWLLTVFGLIAAAVLSFLFFGYGGSLGLMVFLVFGGVLASIGLTSRSAIAAYVISTIGASMRQNLPLPMALESAAAGQTGKRAAILRRIKRWLVEGYSLSESIKRGFPKCPAYVVSLIAAGEKVNQVPQAIKAIEEDMLAKVYRSRKLGPVTQFYPLILLIVMYMLVLLLMTFVIPKYVEVLREFLEGNELPAATQVLMEIASFMAFEYGWLLVIGPVTVISMVYVRVRSRARRPERPYFASRIGDWVKWRLPVWRYYERNASMLRLVESLRLSLNAGCTVNQAISIALDLDMNGSFKRLVRDWLSLVERGENSAVAAKRCALGDALVWAFSEQGNHSNTLSILDTLASNYRSAYNRLIRLLRFILEPCETVCLGLAVGFVVYALFSPIVALIYTVAEYTVP